MQVEQLIHIRTPSGTAACGQPAKQEHIRAWSADITCERCIAFYARRAASA